MNQRVSRRSVLTIAAAGVAAGAVGQLPVLGASQQETSGKTNPQLNWGIIGLGGRGSAHIPLLKNVPQSQVQAICDQSPQQLLLAAAQLPSVTAYSDYKKLLADPQVNAVLIATPSLFHAGMLTDAVSAKKHVLCESAAGVNYADATAMTKAVASATDTVVMFGMQCRNSRRRQKIYELIKDGAIGELRYIVQSCTRGDWNNDASVWKYPDPDVSSVPVNWRYSQTATGGTLNEFSCHHLDVLHWFAQLPHPDRLSADGGTSVYKDGRNTWDYATITLKYPNEVTAIHTLSLFGPERNEMRILGDAGTIIDSPGQPLHLIRKRKGASAILEADDIHPGGQTGKGGDPQTFALYEDFLSCVNNPGTPPQANIDRAIAASTTCWIAELASQSRAEMKWG